MALCARQGHAFLKAFDAALVVTAFAALGCTFNAHTLACAAQRNSKLSKKALAHAFFYIN